MDCTKKLTVAHHKQRRQMKDLVTLDRTTVIASIDPAQTIDIQPKRWQLLACPTATGAADTGENHQRYTIHRQQLLVEVKVGQIRFDHYTGGNTVE